MEPNEMALEIPEIQETRHGGEAWERLEKDLGGGEE